MSPFVKVTYSTKCQPGGFLGDTEGMCSLAAMIEPFLLTTLT